MIKRNQETLKISKTTSLIPFMNRLASRLRITIKECMIRREDGYMKGKIATTLVLITTSSEAQSCKIMSLLEKMSSLMLT